MVVGYFHRAALAVSPPMASHCLNRERLVKVQDNPWIWSTLQIR